MEFFGIQVPEWNLLGSKFQNGIFLGSKFQNGIFWDPSSRMEFLGIQVPELIFWSLISKTNLEGNSLALPSPLILGILGEL